MDIFSVASWVGTVAFALSGFMVGVRKHLDIMGIFILSMITANGGGAIRDVLANRTPWVMTDITAFYLVVGTLAAAYLFTLHRVKALEKSRLFVLCDALGLVAFSVTGALVGLDAGFNVFGVTALAFITAAGGGIIRDLMVNEVPAVLTSDFYGSIAVLLGAAIYALHYFGWQNELNVTLLFMAALVLRTIAYLRQWHLPRLKMD